MRVGGRGGGVGGGGGGGGVHSRHNFFGHLFLKFLDPPLGRPWVFPEMGKQQKVDDQIDDSRNP